MEHSEVHPVGTAKGRFSVVELWELRGRSRGESTRDEVTRVHVIDKSEYSEIEGQPDCGIRAQDT